MSLNPYSVTCGFGQIAKPVSSSNYFTTWLRKLNEIVCTELLAWWLAHNRHLIFFFYEIPYSQKTRNTSPSCSTHTKNSFCGSVLPGHSVYGIAFSRSQIPPSSPQIPLTERDTGSTQLRSNVLISGDAPLTNICISKHTSEI